LLTVPREACPEGTQEGWYLIRFALTTNPPFGGFLFIKIF
jgi:hypothetical protein